MWYAVIYFAVAAFIYGFVKAFDKSKYGKFEHDEIVMFALFWPAMLPVAIAGCVVIAIAGVLYLCLIPFEALGFCAYHAIKSLASRSSK